MTGEYDDEESSEDESFHEDAAAGGSEDDDESGEAGMEDSEMASEVDAELDKGELKHL